MRTLVIGVDGASVETFNRGWTPYIESLIRKGYQLDLTEDLVSRGWVEVFTGKHALETGALYDLPMANGSLQWTTKFNIKKIPGWGRETKPIWQVLNEKGYSVGIMNIPTTFPAPKVNGFFVSGGGGGANVVREATSDLCYPKDIVNYLQSIGYIVDERMPELYENRCDSADEVVSRFILKNKKRTEAFIQLSKEKNIDFGFVVYKTSSVMMEFFTVPELEKMKKGENNVDANLLKLSEEYYQEFDKQIKELVESFENAEVIFVSDHSEIKTSFEVNPNCFLQQNGFQEKQEHNVKTKFVQYAKNQIKSKLPYALTQKIKKLRNKIEKNTGTTLFDDTLLFDQRRTSAFCAPKGDWAKGIYINDDQRFGGIVPKGRVFDVAHEISDRINNDKMAKMHGITSHVKPRTNNVISEYYPDIILDVPDGYILSNSKNEFVYPFEGIKRNDATVDTVEVWLEMMAKKRWLPISVRGYHPLAVSTREWTESILTASNDLTAVYRHIISKFK
jgi:predicted AlkP superfamily phosphohydrolase/phosphomutase